MLLFPEGNIPENIDEYVFLAQGPVTEACVFYLSLSDIDMAYAFTLIKVSGCLPSIRTLKLPGSLYAYCPDQRPITMRLIGKPSPGLSPPMHYYYAYCSVPVSGTH